MFQIKINFLLKENRPIFKNYNTDLFLKNCLELEFQPMLDCHDKKIKKHSGYQETEFL